MAIDAESILLLKDRVQSSSRFRKHGTIVAVVIIAAVVVYGLFWFLFALEESCGVGTRVVPSLQYVVVVSRHGARGPHFTVPNFPYPVNDTEYWPYGFMVLTNNGRDQMYRLGQKVRSLYNGFLDELYYADDFNTQSTDVARTLMSAELFLAGLYPPKGFQVWDEDILWQPIPVFFTYLDHSELAPVAMQGSACPRFKAAQNESIEEFRRENMTDLLNVLEKTQQYSGLTTDNPLTGLYVLWESIYSADVEGLELPSWTSLIYPEPLSTLITKFFTTQSAGSFTQTRLIEGPLFKEIIGFMESKINGTFTSDRKMDYYSGHDPTIIALMSILGLWNADSQFVVPGSALVLELHQDPLTDRYYVQVLYIDQRSADLEPKALDIPGCDAPCDFDSLAAMTKKYYDIEDYDEECQMYKFVK